MKLDIRIFPKNILGKEFLICIILKSLTKFSQRRKIFFQPIQYSYRESQLYYISTFLLTFFCHLAWQLFPLIALYWPLSGASTISFEYSEDYAAESLHAREGR